MSVDDAKALQRLHDELAGREWTVRVVGDVLHVANPAGGLNDEIVYRDGEFRWPWAATPIGPANDVPAAAERIMHVLRAVAE